jgi:hypothetical protein
MLLKIIQIKSKGAVMMFDSGEKKAASDTLKHLLSSGTSRISDKCLGSSLKRRKAATNLLKLWLHAQQLHAPK